MTKARTRRSRRWSSDEAFKSTWGDGTVPVKENSFSAGKGGLHVESLSALMDEYHSCSRAEQEDIIRVLHTELSATRYALNIIANLASGTDVGTWEALEKVRTAVIDILACERVTLYVVYPQSQEVRSQVAPNVPYISVPFGKGVAGTVAQTGQALNIEDAYKCDLFNPSVDKVTGFRTRSILCCPIKDQQGSQVAIMQALNHFDGPFTRVEEQNLQLISVHIANTIRKAQLYEQAQKEKKKSMAFFECMKSLSDQSSLEEISTVVVKAVSDIVDAERASLFLYDEVAGELWTQTAAGLSRGAIRVRVGEGIVGQAAGSREAVVVGDMSERDTEKSDQLGEKTGFVVKTALAVPILDPKGKLIGVIEALNKKGAEFDFTMDKVFTQMDSEAVKLFAGEVGLTMRDRAVEAAFANAIARGANTEDALMVDSSFKALLMEYTATQSKPALSDEKAEAMVVEQAAKMQEPPAEAGPAAGPAAGDGGSPGELGPTKSRKIRLGRRGSVERSWLMTWDLALSEYTKEELVDLSKTMFRVLGINTVFKISDDDLITFIQAVCAHHNDVPYHNFTHVSYVTHGVFLILHTPEAMTMLNDLDRFVLMTAAVCHDLDHNGFTNSFHAATLTELAVRYNDTSILEMHHCATAWGIMSSSSMNFLKGLTPAESAYFRKMLIALILSTDMSKHMDLTKQFKAATFSQDMDDENKVLLMKAILHTVDVGNAVRPQSACQENAMNVQKEFMAQVKVEEEKGFTPAPFMNPKNESIAWQLEVSFIDYVTAPLWHRMAEIFPSLSACVDQITANRDYFQKLSDDLKDENPSVPSTPKAGD